MFCFFACLFLLEFVFAFTCKQSKTMTWRRAKAWKDARNMIWGLCRPPIIYASAHCAVTHTNIVRKTNTNPSIIYASAHCAVTNTNTFKNTNTNPPIIYASTHYCYKYKYNYLCIWTMHCILNCRNTNALYWRRSIIWASTASRGSINYTSTLPAICTNCTVVTRMFAFFYAKLDFRRSI